MIYQVVRLFVYVLWAAPVVGLIIVALPPIPARFGIWLILIPFLLYTLAALVMVRENILRLARRH